MRGAGCGGLRLRSRGRGGERCRPSGAMGGVNCRHRSSVVEESVASPRSPVSLGCYSVRVQREESVRKGRVDGDKNGRTHRHRGRHRAKHVEGLFKPGFHFHYQVVLNATCPHGHYAAVAPAYDLHTSQKVAVKVVSKTKLMKCWNQGSRGEDVRVEVEALRKLAAQPNVVQFIDAYEDTDFFYIVMEFLEGGTLLDYVKTAGRLDEEQTVFLLRQMLTIICLCHKEGVCHRDLKLENFLFAFPEKDYPLKVVDFGSAAFFNDGERNPFDDLVGTLLYMAPEVMKGAQYGIAADVWSLGVILYSMLSGHFPFAAVVEKDLKEQVLHKPVDFSSPEWVGISANATDLIKKMLEKDPDRRISASEALLHPWFQEHDARKLATA